jgi:DNA-binding NarL/FixJ family response regulator
LSYELFWPESEIKESGVKKSGLTPEQVDTIDTLRRGLKHQEAAEELNIERKTYSARVSSLRNRYRVNSDFQLALKLAEDGVISLNTIPKSKTDL